MTQLDSDLSGGSPGGKTVQKKRKKRKKREKKEGGNPNFGRACTAAATTGEPIAGRPTRPPAHCPATASRRPRRPDRAATAYRPATSTPVGDPRRRRPAPRRSARRRRTLRPPPPCSARCDHLPPASARQGEDRAGTTRRPPGRPPSSPPPAIVAVDWAGPLGPPLLPADVRADGPLPSASRLHPASGRVSLRGRPTRPPHAAGRTRRAARAATGSQPPVTVAAPPDPAPSTILSR